MSTISLRDTLILYEMSLRELVQPPSAPVLVESNWLDWSTYWKRYIVTRGVWPFVDPSSSEKPIRMDEVDDLVDVFNRVVNHLAPYLRSRTRHLMTLREVWQDLEALCKPHVDREIAQIRETLLCPVFRSDDTVVSFCTRLREAYNGMYAFPQRPTDDQCRTSLLYSLPKRLLIAGQHIMLAGMPYLDALRVLEDTDRFSSLFEQPEEIHDANRHPLLDGTTTVRSSGSSHIDHGEQPGTSDIGWRQHQQLGQVSSGADEQFPETRCKICRRGNHTTDQHVDPPRQPPTEAVGQAIETRCKICRRNNHTTDQHVQLPRQISTGTPGQGLEHRCRICRRGNHTTEQHGHNRKAKDPLGQTSRDAVYKRQHSKRYGHSIPRYHHILI